MTSVGLSLPKKRRWRARIDRSSVNRTVTPLFLERSPLTTERTSLRTLFRSTLK